MNSPEKKYHIEFNKAVEQYSDMIYRIAIAITGNEEDAKDVFQETFLRLVKNQDKIQSEEHLKAWLIRVSGNCAKTIASNPWNKKTQGFLGEIEGNDQTDDLLKNHLLSELHRLPQKYSMVLYLFYYEGYAIKEIAKLLNKNENSIKTLLNRGRNLLRKRLKEGGEGNEESV
ncbi:MAG: sigma-70 family RNA polymerase sigma factor [Lachnospiraceae bacterium]|nr:sigma-70 family RNA polymerase sigma factor [Lachnospiraceae bacterium]